MWAGSPSIWSMACARELGVPGVIRGATGVMVFANGTETCKVKHAYVGLAASLRPGPGYRREPPR